MERKEYLASIRNTLSIEAQSIDKLKDSLSEDVLLQIIELIGNCKGKVLVSGCGTSGVAAKKIAHSLCCVERPAAFLSPCDAVHGQLGMLQKEDILILISKGGNTSEITNLIPACKKKGARLIGITENEESVLAKQSDILLNIKVEKEPCPFNMMATASILAVIATFDAIVIALMFYTNYTREQFAIIHSGGAVGERLLKNKKS